MDEKDWIKQNEFFHEAKKGINTIYLITLLIVIITACQIVQCVAVIK